MSILPCPQPAEIGRALHAQLLCEAFDVMRSVFINDTQDLGGVALAVHRAAPEMDDPTFATIVGVLAS